MAARKVLHVIPSMGALRGGPSVMLRGLARGLSAHSVDTHVATTDDNGPNRLHVPCGVPLLQDGVTYWYFPRQTRFYTVSWPLASWLSTHVAEFDVVHIHALFSFATLAAAFWAHRHRVPYIVRPLGTLNEWGMKNRRPWLKALSFRLIETAVLKHAALVHYTSDQERLEAKKLRVTANAAVIPNALPHSFTGAVPGRFRVRYPQMGNQRLVLFLSRLDPKKGLDLLLRAFVNVRQQIPDVSLVIAGEGHRDFVNDLKAEAESLGIASNVIWVGFLAGEDKQAAFADSVLYVLPSYSENFGIAVVEAMAAGLPVIVSDQVGIHGQITDAHAGLAVPCDATKLADALVQLLNDSVCRRTMGDNGKSLAHSSFSSAAVTRALVAAYDQILELAPQRLRTET